MFIQVLSVKSKLWELKKRYKKAPSEPGTLVKMAGNLNLYF